MELSDVIPAVGAGVSLRRARVISVSGRSLTVDLGGGITIPALDGCNPVPDQWVYIIGEGSSMTAVGAIGGVYRQASLTVTASTTTTVTGLLNGASTVVSKAGAYTTTAGDILPLLWAADGSKGWALGPGGVPYVPLPDAPPPVSGGGGTVTTGTASYPPMWAGSFRVSGWQSGLVSAPQNGAFFYGGSRFRELQGRTILAVRANLASYAGGQAVSVYGHPHAGPPSGAPTRGYSAGSRTPGGWVNLPLGLAAYWIGGSGTGGLVFDGLGTLSGLPSGTLQFDWRK